jgi:hypothetical protein
MTEIASTPGATLSASRPNARQDLAVAAAYAILVPLFSLLVCAIAFMFGVKGEELGMVAVAMLTTVVAFIPVAAQRLIAPSRRHLFISFFSLIFLIYFALPVFTQYFWHVEESASVTALDNLAPADIIRGQFAALVALVCMMVGFALPLGGLVTTILPIPRHEWGHTNSLIVAVGMVAVGWVLFLSGRLGLVALPSQLGSGLLGTISSSYYFGLALLTIVFVKYRSRPAIVILLAMLPISMLFGFLTGSKKLFLAPAAMIAMAHMVTTRRVRAFWFIAGGIGLIIVYPLAQFYRDVVQVGGGMTAAQVLQNPGRLVTLVSNFLSTADPVEYLTAGIDATTSRLSALGILTVIVRDAGERVPFQGGWTIAMVFVSFIPRFIWPGKPQMAIGQWVTEEFGSGPGIESSTGPSQTGELYFSYGWAGIVIGWLLLGIYFRTISQLFFREGAPTPALLTAVIALWATLPGLQGTLLNFTTGFLFIAVYIAALHLAVRVFMGTTVPGRAPPPSVGVFGSG